MKGSNTIQINQASMVDAVQMYLASLFREGKAPEVVKVEQRPGHTGEDHFEVTIQEADPGPEPGVDVKV